MDEARATAERNVMEILVWTFGLWHTSHVEVTTAIWMHVRSCTWSAPVRALDESAMRHAVRGTRFRLRREVRLRFESMWGRRRAVEGRAMIGETRDAREWEAYGFTDVFEDIRISPRSVRVS